MVKSLVTKISIGSLNTPSIGNIKNRNDPGRFFGDGVQFKAKLIGILEVGEARGDRMCQEALQDLKMAIRAAGEHKQRITIHVTIDGLRLRDEKTGDSLYHHPVHKISFIAQDMTDSRAFGYIFGSPDSGHRFFGIKTDKAASQVVLAMRDLFQVVFELKKKEIELARQQIQSKTIQEHHLSSLSIKNGSMNANNTCLGGTNISGGDNANAGVSGLSSLGSLLDSKSVSKEISPESVADLVDLEQELSSLQRGITQMDRITPNDVPGLSAAGPKATNDDDPFGDSFTDFPTFNLLPPPESGRRNKNFKTNDSINPSPCLLSSVPANLKLSSAISHLENDDENWLNEIDRKTDVLEITKSSNTELSYSPITPSPSAQKLNEPAEFSELEACSFGNMGSSLAQSMDCKEVFSSNLKSDTTATDVNLMMSHETDPFSPTRKKSDPDPFPECEMFLSQARLENMANVDKNDLRINSPQAQASAGGRDVFNGPLQVSLPPEIAAAGVSSRNSSSPDWKAEISYLEMTNDDATTNKTNPNTPQQRSAASSAASSYMQAAAFKQQTVDVISSISNKKMPHLFGQPRFTKRDSNSINMRRLQESDSLSETETAPEPPPRPDSSTFVEPPPLPPKKQLTDTTLRSRTPFNIDISIPTATTAASSSSSAANQYESLNSVMKSNVSSSKEDLPPIPLPSRKFGKSDGEFPGPERPRKNDPIENDYLTPISIAANAEPYTGGPKQTLPLLPPPIHNSSRSRNSRQQTVDIYENKEEILQQQKKLIKEDQFNVETNAPIAPDITLTQLLTLGIDDLAKRLNVPTSKLSTMTLVELTSYLSEFLCEKKTNTEEVAPEPAEPATENAVFKINFDQESTFIAKFDDTFGEDIHQSESSSFVANFDQFNGKFNERSIPSADRYAVFREIIDEDMQHMQETTDLMGDVTPPAADDRKYQNNALNEQQLPNTQIHFEAEFDKADLRSEEEHQTQSIAHSQTQQQTLNLPKIDTKITQVVAQAKDRYAALRDIILVENLFDNVAPVVQESSTVKSEIPDFSDELNEYQELNQMMPSAENDSPIVDPLALADNECIGGDLSASGIIVTTEDVEENGAEDTSGDSTEKDSKVAESYEEEMMQDAATKPEDIVKQNPDIEQSKDEKLLKMETSNQNNTQSLKQDNLLPIASQSNSLSYKDDFEIDELMQRAISNLSLDSREIISPANSLKYNTQRQTSTNSNANQSQYNDVSTSPMPLQQSYPDRESSRDKYNPIKTSPQVSSISPMDMNGKKSLATEKEAAQVCSKTESWATFDKSKPEPEVHTSKPNVNKAKSISSSSSHLPLPLNASHNNDTAESPCSSDQRDEDWKRRINNRRWPKTEKQQTSSSSRDLSPWDDDAQEYQKHKLRLHVPAVMSDRHYHKRHVKRMNSCDEDFDYEDEMMSRREHRKMNQGLSRSRDNFDMDSPNSWYHHMPYTWTSQDIEQARVRFFERNAYERTTYGPPLYDKRGLCFPTMHSGSSSYDRRLAAGGYEKRKYCRDYGRPNYEIEDFPEGPPISERGMYRGDSVNFEKMKAGRRPDYENLNIESGRYKFKTDCMYERERKSFDRESLESFESSSRKHKSFGSGGDMYGGLESREDFCDRYPKGSGSGSMKNRSSRRGSKLRVSGDIDYEQDSDGDFAKHQSRGRGPESRSQQRPSQLSTSGAPSIPSQSRNRKSSGSSPWDGEETMFTGIKPWKRPNSAAESERRLAESRRATGMNPLPSGSDGEKERRIRKKIRSRGSKGDYTSGSGCGSPSVSSCSRYGNVNMISRTHENFDYIACNDDDYDDDDDYEDDEPPTDDDKFERLSRRRHEVDQKMHECEHRAYTRYKKNPSSSMKSISPVPQKCYQINIQSNLNDDFTSKPASMENSTQPSNCDNQITFDFDAEFESDFKQNSPTPLSSASNKHISPANKQHTFRFSNDFSDQEGSNISSNFLQESADFDMHPAVSPSSGQVGQPIQQKLRFDDKVKVSQFSDTAFEDDFSKATFDFSKDNQKVPAPKAILEMPMNSTATTAAKKQTLRNNKLQQRQELLKKSDSVNIFAKKVNDPFEDDDFFRETTHSAEKSGPDDSATKSDNSHAFTSDTNFATFEDNM